MKAKRTMSPCREVRAAGGTCHMVVRGAAHNRTRLGKHKMTPVAIKAQYLMAEGKPRDVAFATAFSMQRAGRLTRSGKYKRAKRG